jgi:hypothetical protein
MMTTLLTTILFVLRLRKPCWAYRMGRHCGNCLGCRGCE